MSSPATPSPAAPATTASSLAPSPVKAETKRKPSDRTMDGSLVDENKGLMAAAQRKSITLKFGMMGDTGVGKTSLSVKYCEGVFGHDYVPTLGVLPHGGKTIAQKAGDIKISIFDIGGSPEFKTMLKITCDGAHGLIYVFDLCRATPTLQAATKWYNDVKQLYPEPLRSPPAYLVGCKFDTYLTLPTDQQTEINVMAKRVAAVMKAPLVYVSAAAGINVQTLFKLILLRALPNQPVTIPKRTAVGEPLLIYDDLPPTT